MELNQEKLETQRTPGKHWKDHKKTQKNAQNCTPRKKWIACCQEKLTIGHLRHWSWQQLWSGWDQLEPGGQFCRCGVPGNWSQAAQEVPYNFMLVKVACLPGACKPGCANEMQRQLLQALFGTQIAHARGTFEQFSASSFRDFLGPSKLFPRVVEKILQRTGLNPTWLYRLTRLIRHETVEAMEVEKTHQAPPEGSVYTHPPAKSHPGRCTYTLKDEGSVTWESKSLEHVGSIDSVRRHACLLSKYVWIHSIWR